MGKRIRLLRQATTLRLLSFLPLLVATPAGAQQAATRPSGTAEHVVVIVWDGLRPDSVNEHDTPTLYRLARDGTTFARHHSVYPTSTEVNGTALATGMFPVHSGVMSNREYRPAIELLKSIAIEDEDVVRKGDRVTAGKYLLMPTVAERVRGSGRRSVVAGTKPVALLLDRAERGGAIDTTSVDVAQGKVLPASAQENLNRSSGPFPAKANPTRSANVEQDQWTTHVLIDRLWHGDVPAFTTLWFSEPDYAQHGSGPGSAVAKAALKSDDDNFSRVLDALTAAGARNTTDILIVSDHGFSTISRTVDIVGLLRAANFDTAETFAAEPKEGQVFVVTNGGSASFYVIGHDGTVTRRLVDFLQRSDFAGVVFTRDQMDGTFTLEQANLKTPEAPDILVSMRWTDEKSATGLPGMLIGSNTKYAPGQGFHASLGRYDVKNTLIASGPDFRNGFVDELPSSNSDVAPTVLHLLGLPTDGLDGRVMTEAMSGERGPLPTVETTTLEASHPLPDHDWIQYLRLSKVGTHIYFDEGNRGRAPSTADAVK